MKKLLVFAVTLVLSLTLICCAATFDVEKSIEMLQEQGLTLSTVYTTERELTDGTALANSEIKLMGGDFTVELKAYSSLIQHGAPSKNCQFFTFATQEQASAYADLYAASRRVGSAWRVAQSGCVVVITNLDLVQEQIDLEFR